VLADLKWSQPHVLRIEFIERFDVAVNGFAYSFDRIGTSAPNKLYVVIDQFSIGIE